MKKSKIEQVTAPVRLHKKIAPDHYLMRLEAPRMAMNARPGQFIHVLCGLSSEALLRRPFSLLDVNADEGTLDFIYKVVGLGTQALTEVQAGSTVDLLGPLGSVFRIPKNEGKAFLIGGGVGIPPLYFLAKHLGRREVTAVLGARKKEWVICAELFRQLGVKTYIATDDGSMGFRGSAVDLLEMVLPKAAGKGATLYICGPTPMMAAAAAWAGRKKIAAQVSLEERMGCAMGCCMGCVVEIASESATSHKRFQRVCTEGPVFQADQVVWKTH